MLVPMQLQFTVTLNIYKAGAAHDGRIVIDRFLLWVPKIIAKDSLFDKFVSSFLKEGTWTYLREMYNYSTTPRQSSGFFQISSSIDNVQHVFVYLQRAKTDNAEQNPYIFDTYKLNAGDEKSYLSSCRLEYGNGVFYPEVEYFFFFIYLFIYLFILFNAQHYLHYTTLHYTLH